MPLHFGIRNSRCLLLVVTLALAFAGRLNAQTITTQPKSQTVNLGTAVTFTVVATGTSLTYQWALNGTNLTGATAATYVIASATAASAGNYTVVVASGAATTTSSTATLLVYAPYIVKTLAGQVEVFGSANGTGTAAQFSSPQGIASDTAGNLYVADTANCTIRKVTPQGVVTTLAGTQGVPGTADGTGTAAQFNYPSGIAIDASGNIYVADTFNCTIRKVTLQGVVTTLAGLAPTASNPTPTNAGSTNGTGTAARFNFPRGVAVDGFGNIYVADTLNSLIRMVTPQGVVTSVVGNSGATPQSVDGTGTAAHFDYPFGIASDAAGDLWVSDTSGQTIRAVTKAGVVTTLAGLYNNTGSGGGAGAFARFNQPVGIAVDALGNLYIADQANSTVRQVSSTGVVSTLAGLAGNVGSVDASGSSARLFNPFGIAVDGAGNVYVADTQNSTIRVAVPQLATQFAPIIGAQPANQTVNQGATVSFTISASGSPVPTYQWTFGGTNIAGATNATLTLTNVQSASAGSYAAVVTNSIGNATSNSATLTVNLPPSITTAPAGQSVSTGSNVTLTVVASGTAPITYQWLLNGSPLSGATGASLVLSNIGTNQRGSYSVVVTNSVSAVTSSVATVAVASSARLLNLSARASVSSAANMVAGFVTTGTGTKQMLLRGVGPGLTQLGISGALANPLLTLFNSNAAVIGANSGWGGGAALSQIFSQVGAFALSTTSADAALLQTLPAGSYTDQLGGVGNSTGVGLAEIYDADTGTPPARLINLSARANVGVGSAVLVAGFVIGGTTSETVLIRGIGPALAVAPFNLTGTLARPVLTVQDSTGKLLATNSGWGGSAALSTVFSQVYAFSLAAASNDAAVLLTLAPGAYTGTVSGLNNTTGNGLVEVYEVP